MTRWRFLLVLVLPALSAGPSSAGIFFHKHPKPDPSKRVPELIAILRTDHDDHKRAAAAQELRNFDPAAYPEIVPTLVNAAQNDPKPGVRLEALQSLSKLRPVTQQAGMALEQAMANDSSMKVRLMARTALVQYHLSGYHGSKTPESPADGPKLEEPPLAGPPGPAPAILPQDPRVPAGLSKPSPAPTPRGFNPSSARPLPIGPANPPLVPVPSSGAEPPLAPPGNDGPDLTPPK
jgi:hypothetical protein